MIKLKISNELNPIVSIILLCCLKYSIYLYVVYITIIVFNKANGHTSFTCFCIMYNENNKYAITRSSGGTSNANVLNTPVDFLGVRWNIDIVNSPMMCILKNKKPNIKLCLVKKLLLFVDIICNYVKKK